MTDATLFSAFAGDRRLDGLAADPRPAFVWSVEGRLLWANAAGASALGVTVADVAGGRAATGALAGDAARIARVVQGGGAARIERLRFPGLGRLAPVACACRRLEAPDGAAVLLMTATEVPRWLRRGPAAEPAAGLPKPAPETAEPPTWRWLPNEEGAAPLRPGGPAAETAPAASESPAPPAAISADAAPAAPVLQPEGSADGDRPADRAEAEAGPPPEAAAEPAFAEPSAGPAPDLAVAGEAAGTPPDLAAGGQPEPPASPAAEPEAETAVPVPERLPLRTAPIRFVFQTAADGRFVSVSPELATGIGEAATLWHGRRFAEVAAEAGLDPDGPLARAFAGQATWTGLGVTWPDPAARTLTAIEMSALPVFDRNRAFQGFRGFGICRPPTIMPDAGEAAGEATPAPSAAASPEAEQSPPAIVPDPPVAPVAAAEPEQPMDGATAPEARIQAEGAAPAGEAAAPVPAEAELPISPATMVGPEEAVPGVAEPGAGIHAVAEHPAGEGAAPVHAEAEPPLHAVAEPVGGVHAEAEPPAGEGAAPVPAEAERPLHAVVEPVGGIHAEAEHPAGEAAAPVPPEAEPPVASTATEEARPVSEQAAADRREPATDAGTTPVIPLAAAREARALSDSNVVRLHQGRPVALDRPALSPSERNAFREIARALGARVEGDEEGPPASAGQRVPDAPAEPQPPADAAGTAERAEAPAGAVDAASPTVEAPADRPSAVADEARWSADDDVAGAKAKALVEAVRRQLAQAEPSAPPQAVSAESAEPAREGAPPETPVHALSDRDSPDQAPQGYVPLGFIDRLPLGILVARGEDLLFANRTLLDLTGYADIEAMRRAGGLERLFAGPGPLGRPDEDAAGAGVLLRRADEETIAVDGRVQTTPWNGESALLISIRRRLVLPVEPPAAPPPGDTSAEDARQAALAAGRRADELQAVLDTATDGVIILDADGSIVGINRSAEALFGYETEAIAGKSLAMLLAQESHRAAFDYLDSLRRNGVASVLNDGREVTGRVRQGGLVPLSMTLGRIGEADGSRFCAVLRDMTTFKKAEAELTDARRRAEDASSQKSDFLAKISHEIRTPLNAIVGFAELMMEERFGPLGNDRYRAYARDIHASGGHVISLVDDLLDLSKIEAGRMELSFASVDLNEVVQQAVAIMQPQANGGRIIIRSALAPRLPNVVADGRSLRQIVLNLLSNSVKFTPPAGQIIVSTTLSERGEAVLRVRDTGEGMTEKELAVALEPFRQVATASASARGTGLGLPLTKALVEANRATFSIQSAKNAGTIVEVVFPPMRVLAE
ncbi:ATP-binding protein [Labrys wisconsinensis]|uniref:histidine kinase n=1 Tax=Labrys wisconsinensis TaxID=425677 RepID=A0ABU0JHP2_9HYPH|nr:ATP-binding protein [Labrys wisconsinensis]MDQ0472637.1 PAS domain S-box-containing protein [Labrys wisconsinensis]